MIYQNAIPPETLRTRIDGVVIGASAGGVEALAVLLPALPATFRPPLFIVLHLPRERPSLLVEIFARRCARPVREADDKEPIEPGTVYFAPPDYHMLVEKNRQIALSADEPIHFSRPSSTYCSNPLPMSMARACSASFSLEGTRMAPQDACNPPGWRRHRSSTAGQRQGTSHGNVRPAARTGGFRTVAS